MTQRSLPTIRAGSSVWLRAEIFDNSVYPPEHFTPATGVQISIIDPDGVERVTLAPMQEQAVGFYRYRYQTTETDPLGPWLAWIKVNNGGSIDMTLDLEVFITVAR